MWRIEGLGERIIWWLVTTPVLTGFGTDLSVLRPVLSRFCSRRALPLWKRLLTWVFYDSVLAASMKDLWFAPCGSVSRHACAGDPVCTFEN